MLSQKNILLISPQEWNDLYISKHHYALELSQRGNKVFFLEPPSHESSGISISSTEHQNLSLVKFGIPKWYKTLQHHLRWLFDLLMRRKIREICKALPQLDICWSFEPNLYTDLKLFNGNTTIFHPVDFLVNMQQQQKPAKSADIIFSVSKNILELFEGMKVPTYLVNHGLSNKFIQSSSEVRDYKRGERLSFAYTGNLTIDGLDRDSLIKVVQDHPEIDFYFYGKAEKQSNNPLLNDFLNSLNNAENSQIVGFVSPDELSKRFVQHDGFLLSYQAEKELNSGSNSHKLLEYLASGKVVVSSFLSEYEDQDLFVMSRKKDNSDFSELFDKTIKSIEEYNSKERMIKRVNFARQNSYENQIIKIEEYLSSHGLIS